MNMDGEMFLPASLHCGNLAEKRRKVVRWMVWRDASLPAIVKFIGLISVH